MVLLLCKNCGNHITTEDLKDNNLIDISKCPSCGTVLQGAEKIKTTKKEQNLEDWAIGKMIEERMNTDSGKRYSMDEVEAMLKEKIKNSESSN